MDAPVAVELKSDSPCLWCLKPANWLFHEVREGFDATTTYCDDCKPLFERWWERGLRTLRQRQEKIKRDQQL